MNCLPNILAPEICLFSNGTSTTECVVNPLNPGQCLLGTDEALCAALRAKLASAQPPPEPG